ncbi:MAG: SsrA-binding protein [Deltaproteobacteria bacterium RIFCSPHIGHO2_12_FULL_43_9]|nr:MAG: SsrA-binding protein [Deltaproteobacteria bacterium RIFCSPHIGHO2_12_FULL_43_9]
MTDEGIKIVATNRKAMHDYFIEERFEAGIVLLGSEVKSLRDGKAQLLDSYVIVRNGELFVLNMHISPYSHANVQNHEPLRTRKLLMNKNEIIKLSVKIREKGLTLIPLKIYFKKGKAKLELGLAKGKKKYDKREAIKKKEARRSIKRYVS